LLLATILQHPMGVAVAIIVNGAGERASREHGAGG
jgi:hypothetical protein